MESWIRKILSHNIGEACSWKRQFKYLSFLFGRSSSLLLATDFNSIVLEIPLLKWSCINLNNCTLHQGLCPNQLIVRGIIHHIQQTSLPCNSLATPREIPSIQPQSTPLHITSSDSYPSNSLSIWHQLCVCWLSAKLIPSQKQEIRSQSQNVTTKKTDFSYISATLYQKLTKSLIKRDYPIIRKEANQICSSTHQ